MLGPLGIHLDEVEVLDLVFLDELEQREAVHLAESESGDRREPARAQGEWGGLRLRAGRTRTGWRSQREGPSVPSSSWGGRPALRWPCCRLRRLPSGRYQACP
jgi:hypothetical protein